MLTDAHGQVLDRSQGAVRASKARLADVGLSFHVDSSNHNVCVEAICDPVEGTPMAMVGVTGAQGGHRADLKQIVQLAAASIELTLLRRLSTPRLVRLSWPTMQPASGPEGWLALDSDGQVLGCTTQARVMAPDPLARPGPHAIGRVLATTTARLQHAQQHPGTVLSLSLWSGLNVQVQVVPSENPVSGTIASPMHGTRWRDQEISLIRNALNRAHGNVSAAARALGMSRATLYRKLGRMESE